MIKVYYLKPNVVTHQSKKLLTTLEIVTEMEISMGEVNRIQIKQTMVVVESIMQEMDRGSSKVIAITATNLDIDPVHVNHL